MADILLKTARILIQELDKKELDALLDRIDDDPNACDTLTENIMNILR